MPIEEICKLIAQKLLQGCMNHEQFINYYDFLGLEGFKLCHEYHFLEQMINYRQFISFYIQHQNRLIPNYSEGSLTSFSIIPNNWFEYTRGDMDINTRRNAVKNGVEKYLRWETQTEKFLEDMYSQAIQQGFIAISLQIKKYLCSVGEEIKKANRMWLELKATDYDLPTIVSKQRYLAKKYKKKLCQTTLTPKQRKEFDYDKSSRG